MNSKNAFQLIELAKESNLHQNITVRRTLRALCISWDEHIAEDLESLLLYHSAPRKLDIFQPFEAKGKFELGSNLSITRDQLTQGMLVVGRSGAGKTNLFYYLMKQFINARIPCLALDFKKDYRHLIQENPDLIVIPWEYLRLNLLKPPKGVAPIRWLQDFTEVFGHSQALLSGSKNFVMSQLYKLYELYGVFEGSGNYPTMLEFQELLNKTRYSMISKDARYLETVRNRVNASVLAFDKVFDCADGLPIEELLNKNVVIELDGLMEDQQNFIIEILLVWIYNYRLAQGHRGKLRHCIFFDEAKRVFDRNKERNPDAGLPIIDIITDRSREFGEALIVGDQEPGKLTDSIKANTFTKIMLSLGSGKDISDMSKCMGLDKEQVDYSYSLKVGNGIAKLSGEPPCLVQIPFVPIKKDVTDLEVVENLKQKMMGFRITPRTRPERFEEYIAIAPSKKQKPDKEMSEDARRLLQDINEHQVSPLKDRYRRINISSSKGTRAKKELVSNGLVNEVEVNTKEKGGRPKLLEATERGNDHLLLDGHVPNGNNGKGGLKHRYWQEKVKEYYEKWGCRAQIEVGIGKKKSVDVVALSHHHQVENIEKNLEFGFNEIIVACKDDQTMKLIQKQCREVIGKPLPGNIRFCLLKQYNGSD